MRTIIVILFCFIIFKGFGQTDPKINFLQKEFERYFDGKLKLGEKITIAFIIDSNNNLIVKENNEFRKLIFQKIKPNKNIFLKNNYHSFHLLNDSIRNRIYSTYFYEGVGDFTQYYMQLSFSGGFNRFKKLINQDFRKKIDLNKIDEYDWNRPLKFIVNAEGNVKFIEKNNIATLIDSMYLKKWHPQIYDGYPTSSYVKTSIIKKEEYIEHGMINFDIEESKVVLPSIFQNKIVAIQPKRFGKIDADVVVSFVITNNCIYSPHIEHGDHEIAKNLINFIISEKNKSNKIFQLNSFYPERYFFYILDI